MVTIAVIISLSLLSIMVFYYVKTRVALRHLQLRFDLATKGSGAGIYDWDITNGTITHNKNVNIILGYAETEDPELSLDSFLKRLHPEDAERVGNAVNQHLTSGAPYETEFRMQRKDGSYIWVADSAMAMRNKKNEPTLWAGTMINIDSKKKFEEGIVHQNEELKVRNAQLDLLIHQLSHDFQSPLGRIIGLVDITQLEGDMAKRDELIQLISQQTKSLSSYVREVVEYSKSVREKPMLEKMDLNSILNEVLSAVKPLENDDIDYQLQVPEPLIISSDKIALTAILSNLLSNSVRYRDKRKANKFIAIKCQTTDHKIILSIEDNGIGIGQEHQNKIFDIFYRVPSPLKGSGLGLYIVKESVKKLNGKITLSSQLGVGSQFVVELPTVLSPN